MAHGPAVPAATMKLCTQWGEYSEVGNDAEGLEEARGGGTVSAPQRDDAIHSWDEGVRTNVYRSVSPSISLSLSTNLHDYYLLPSPLCISGNRARNGNLIPASFHSIARTSIEWLDIDRVGDISVKRD